MHHHHVGPAADTGHRRYIADEIEIEMLIERRVDRIRRTRDEERISVRARPHHRLGPDRAACTRPVVDDERLAEPLRQRLTDQTREDVKRAAGGEADDDVYRPRWISLRFCDTRESWERGSARQMEKLPTWKFHKFLPASSRYA